MSHQVPAVSTDQALAAFGQEFGKVLDPVAFLNTQDPQLCAAFLRLHEQQHRRDNAQKQPGERQPDEQPL